MAADASPFSVVARQIVQDECPDADPSVLGEWAFLQSHFFEALTLFYGVAAEKRWSALAATLQGLKVLLENLTVAYQCPLACTRHFRQAAEWALALGHAARARALMQLGNIFKLQAMARWWNTKGTAQKERFEPRMQVEYTISVTQLHDALQTPLRPLGQRFAALGGGPRVEVHSICTYKPDPTSNTGLDCPLPELSVPNHRRYAGRYGHHYVLHTELPLPDREAHYSKMLVIHEALRSERAPDWVFFVDCDAFFTNMAVPVADILEAYGAAGPLGPHFLVAEDPGGINTGTMLFRRSEWSLRFLERVAASQFGVAWDQSMFFWEILRPSLMELSEEEVPLDYRLPPEVAFVHQAHLNAFVSPASRDWSAYEWRPGDFVRHFAGCPWQEKHCLNLMQETAALAAAQA